MREEIIQEICDKVKELCEFFKENNRFPSRYEATSKTGQDLSQFRNRLNYRKNKKLPIRDEYLNIIDQYGITQYFFKSRPKPKTIEEGLECIDAIHEFFKRTGKLPSIYTSNKSEEKLGMFISYLRKLKTYFPSSPKFKVYNKRARTLKFSQIFTFNNKRPRRRSEKDILKNIEKICKFHDKHGRYPNQNYQGEIQLANQLNQLKFAKHGKNTYTFKEIFQQKANACNHPGLFNLETSSDKKEKTINLIGHIAAFFHEYGKYPSQSSDDEFERKISRLLSNLRQAKRKKDKRKSIKQKLLPEYLKKAEECGLPRMFNLVNKKR